MVTLTINKQFEQKVLARLVSRFYMFHRSAAMIENISGTIHMHKDYFKLFGKTVSNYIVNFHSADNWNIFE